MKVVTIGNATLDIGFKSGEFKSISNKKLLCLATGSKFYVNDVYFNLGGGAINSAFTFAKLGLETDIYFKIGKDFIGRIISSMLKNQIIQLQSEQQIERVKICAKIFNNQSSFSVILLPQNADRIILAYHSRDYYKWELKDFPKNIKDSFVFINTDETFAKTWKIYLQKLKNRNNFISLNPSKPFLRQGNKKGIMEILNLTDIVILNKEEAQLFLAKKITNEKKLIKEFRKILIKPKILVITMGNRGIITVIDLRGLNANRDGKSKDFIFYSPGFKAEKIADGTGAGDAFGSAFCSYLIKHGLTRNFTLIDTENKFRIDENDIKEAIRWGCANAVSVIENIGGQTGILTEADYQDKRFKNLNILTYEQER
jgi:sugar/nucleoside kinase (ribokinase family)